ncbi:MAG: hypothetical protein IPI10_04385 [Bacteroidetes bacterium]|nr:hypothetical protein [Bacteroidota bacterium]
MGKRFSESFQRNDVGIFDLGSREKLGTGIAVYPYIDFPLSAKKMADGSFVMELD